MTSKWHTAKEFIKNIGTVGAFKQTSVHTEREITSKVPRSEDVVVVEYGAGHGNITQAILDRITPDSRLISFEINTEFYHHLENKIHDERLTLVNAGAECLPDYVHDPVNLVISSLPFSFFSKELGDTIMNQTYEYLVPGGYYSQILYAFWASRRFEKKYSDVVRKIQPTLPPEIIFHCRKSLSEVLDMSLFQSERVIDNV